MCWIIDLGSNPPTPKVNWCHGLIIKNHHETNIMRERERERERESEVGGGEREGATDPSWLCQKVQWVSLG